MNSDTSEELYLGYESEYTFPKPKPGRQNPLVVLSIRRVHLRELNHYLEKCGYRTYEGPMTKAPEMCFLVDFVVA